MFWVGVACGFLAFPIVILGLGAVARALLKDYVTDRDAAGL